MSNPQKTFHLAITMAGAISAGAYTAGVFDFLLEALDEWEDMRKEAADFFEDFPALRGKSWESFKKTTDYTETAASGRNLEDLEKKAIRYNSVPDHNIQIEIISGASAGGMTAAIAALVFQLENKHHVKFLPDVKNPDTLRQLEQTRANNRLYNSWVNLTGDDMVSVLLNNDDINFIGKPVSALNSKFIRDVAQRALTINENDEIGLAPYISDDFNLFVTLTNLEGYQKSLIIDQSGQRAEGGYGEFITYEHSDLLTFSFGENEQDGTVNINFREETSQKNKNNIKLLGDAAVATVAFPIGLEYASFARKPNFINKNSLLTHIHSDTRELVADDKDYLSTFVDGGLINNEPFELTDFLLKARLKTKMRNSRNPEIVKLIKEQIVQIKKDLAEVYEEGLSDEKADEKIEAHLDRFLDDEVRKRKNHTILMIDPFPSEKKIREPRKADRAGNYYPFDLLGALVQLVSVMRTQLLVKSNLFSNARDITDFSCYLIAPRRRAYEKSPDGKILFEADGNPKPCFEKDEKGDFIFDDKGELIPKIYDGSAAIACGSLGGFGGFLDKEFRVHDFYLGRLNCQSFLRKHFRIKADGENSIDNAVTAAYSKKTSRAYSGKMKEIYQKECGAEYVPIIPDMYLLREETRLSSENPQPSITDLYIKLKFPKYNMDVFDGARDKILARIWAIVESLAENYELNFLPRNVLKTAFWFKKKDIFKQLSKFVEAQLKKWELLK